MADSSSPSFLYRPLGKWSAVCAFWALQSLAIAFVSVLWRVSSASVDGPKGRLFGVITLGDIWQVICSGPFWNDTLPVIFVMMLGQAMFLAPVASPRGRSERGMPLALSILGGGLMMAALIIGVLFLLHEIGLSIVPEIARQIDLYRIQCLIPFIAACALSWLIASVLVYRFCIRRLRAGDTHEDVLSRLAARLFLGTIIEVAAIIPLDVMVRRRVACYCWTSSYFALTICGAVGLVLLGPIVFLPILARRRKRWFQGKCDACGYDMTALLASGHPVDRCPECGAGWKPRSVDPTPANTP